MNMDYAFASALRHSSATVLKVSYDIACQWHKKLHQRVDKMPPHLRLNLHDRDITFLVPKFHFFFLLTFHHANGHFLSIGLRVLAERTVRNQNVGGQILMQLP